MNTLPQADPASAREVFLYGRNSSDDQAEAGTIKNQQTFLGNYASLYGLHTRGAFWDEGVSGTIPLGDRPEGRKLLEAASARPGAVVLVYRLDRLGRNLRSLLDAHDRLEGVGVTIRSATEPFDTSTSIGKFLFQLLASLAELERSTIIERMTLGRDRVARNGKWTGGPVPFGYDIGPDGCLVPSERIVAGRTEAETARDVIERIAAGSSCVMEAARLNALGVPALKRWSSGVERVSSGQWRPDRVLYMVRNSTYAGTHVINGRNGAVERPAPALVDRATLERAQAQLVKNRILATKNARRVYLLRGLLKCACGRSYVGVGGGNRRKGQESRWYRCLSQTGVTRHQERCNAKSVQASALERLVWADCREWARDPGQALADAQRQLRERLERAPSLEQERRCLQEVLAAKDLERERVMTLFRRGRSTLEETERQLDAIQRETSDVLTRVEALRAQEDLSAVFEAQYADATVLLGRIHQRIDEIERGLCSDELKVRAAAQAEQRTVVETLVAGITIRTEGEGSRRQAVAEIRYVFGSPNAVVMGSATPTRTRSCIELGSRLSS